MSIVRENQREIKKRLRKELKQAIKSYKLIVEAIENDDAEKILEIFEINARTEEEHQLIVDDIIFFPSRSGVMVMESESIPWKWKGESGYFPRLDLGL